MKKIRKLGLFLFMLSCMCFAACGRQEMDLEKSYQIYFVSNSETKVEAHGHELQAEDATGQLQELLQCLGTIPEKLEYKAPLAMGLTVQNV